MIKKLRWLTGILVVDLGKGRFGAVGPGEIVELPAERAESLVHQGVATFQLAADPFDQELAGPEPGELEGTARIYNKARADCKAAADAMTEALRRAKKREQEVLK